ncbi:MAG: 8-oxo-dGTP diphosphatase [Anaerolineae bacterium]
MTFPSHIINGALCYIIHNEQVLLLQRSRPPHVGLWSAPGGKMEHTESPQETVVREIFEETGLTVHDPVLRALQTSVDKFYPVHWMLYIFVATAFNGELKTTAEGVLQWHNVPSVAHLARPYPDTCYWQHIISHQPGIWQGKFVYDTPEKLLEETVYSGG